MRLWAGAGVLAVARSTGRILVQLRGFAGDYPGFWAPAGGSLEVDRRGRLEEPAFGAMREFYEETGYGGALLVSRIHRDYDRGRGFRYDTYVGLIDDEFEPLLSNEAIGWVWATPEELLELQRMHPGLERLLSDPEALRKLELVSRTRRQPPGAVTIWQQKRF